MVIERPAATSQFGFSAQVKVGGTTGTIVTRCVRVTQVPLRVVSLHAIRLMSRVDAPLNSWLLNTTRDP